MKNRGLLTRPMFSPLGNHKDPIPSDLPNRQVASPIEEPAPIESIEHSLTRRGQQPTEGPGLPPQAVSHTTPTHLTKRYTLILKLDPALLHRVDTSLASLDPASKSTAKRAIVQGFRNSILATLPYPMPAFAMADPVPYRIDIRLSDELVGKIISASSSGPFELRSTVLARFLSPHFGGFLEEAFARRGKPVTTLLAMPDEPEVTCSASQN